MRRMVQLLKSPLFSVRCLLLPLGLCLLVLALPLYGLYELSILMSNERDENDDKQDAEAL